MSELEERLHILEAALRRLARSPIKDERDIAVLNEAQIACECCGELLRNNRAAQARYACFYAEACVAVLQHDLQSAEMRRKILA